MKTNKQANINPTWLRAAWAAPGVVAPPHGAVGGQAGTRGCWAAWALGPRWAEGPWSHGGQADPPGAGQESRHSQDHFLSHTRTSTAHRQAVATALAHAHTHTHTRSAHTHPHPIHKADLAGLTPESQEEGKTRIWPLGAQPWPVAPEGWGWVPVPRGEDQGPQSACSRPTGPRPHPGQGERGAVGWEASRARHRGLGASRPLPTQERGSYNLETNLSNIKKEPLGPFSQLGRQWPNRFTV